VARWLALPDAEGEQPCWPKQVAPIDKLSFVLAMVLGIRLRERPAPHILWGALLIGLGVLLTLKPLTLRL